MNFFKSVISDDPDPSESGGQNPDPTMPTITTAWTFGSSLMKTLASKSESVIETYRRDLEDFSSGLKKETAGIREATSRAVKDLPSSLEAGAGLAQESLESVGQAIDNLGTTVTELIAHGKDSIFAVDYSDTDSDSDVTDAKQISSSSREELASMKPYSRLDAQIRTIQSDMKTYLEDPEDVLEYKEWKLGFKIDEKADETDLVVWEIYREIVPKRVDEESFWSRYFYRVYKVKRAEEARARLVKRAISGEEDEELSWDVEEDDHKENIDESEEKLGVSGSKNGNEIDNFEAKTSSTDKDSDITIVSIQTSHEEEDGWDEIDDIGSSSYENKDKVELGKRLNVGEEEEEDLTWDIDDDDDDTVST